MSSKADNVVNNEYTGLPGTFRAAGLGQPRAYLGPNHLLCMRTLGSHELVRRFYYADITGLRCLRTRRGLVINAVFMACAALPWVFVLISGMLTYGVVAGASTATTIFLLLLLFNVGLGATCVTYLHTVNHTERLPSLGRYRTARKALAHIHEKITEVQGAIEMLDDGKTLPAFSPATRPMATVVSTPRYGRSRLVETVFYLSILLALSYVIDFWYNLEWKNTMDMIVVTVMAVLAPAALIRTYRLDCARQVRVTAGILLAYHVTVVPQLILATVLVAALDLDGMTKFMENPGGIASLSPADGAVGYVMLGYNALSIFILGVCGLTGLLALWRRGAPLSDSDAAIR